MMKDKILKMLNDHDWTYEMSDDHNAYLKGKQQLEEIQFAIKCAKALGEDISEIVTIVDERSSVRPS